MPESPLSHFIQRYLQAWQRSLGTLPACEQDEPGPALQGRDEEGRALWQPVAQQPQVRFDNIEAALSLTLHPSVSAHYGQFFAGPLQFDAEFGQGELLQLWSPEELPRLQENLIGHLMMKRSLKQPATIFIGLLGEGEEMLVLENESGSVWLEIPGQLPHQRLAESLEGLLSQLSPRVALPPMTAEEAVPDEAPGLLPRLKRMWSHLRRG
ncbi:SecY-interacting protein [Ferrimonas gelatinilytica]|uniref:Protein Syd n=2 Tax=Ferrimonas gelatinilytica TaxID=1255257 RepID=A0ABP9S2L2_9GAMM